MLPSRPHSPPWGEENSFRSRLIKALAQVGTEAQGLQMRPSVVRSLPPELASAPPSVLPRAVGGDIQVGAGAVARAPSHWCRVTPGRKPRPWG